MSYRVLCAVAAGMAVSGFAAQALGCDRVLPESLRILDCRLADATSEALPLSPTLRAQVAEIESQHGVVYVTTRVVVRPGTPHRLAGVTANNVDRAGDRLIVRVEVSPFHDDTAIATLAHELHHVTEILRHADAHEYYSVSATTVETDGAQEVERLVLHELRTVRAGHKVARHP